MITIRHLVKKFGALTVLKDVNAQIEKGEVISLIGPSGSGKSTLLRCLNMLEPPTAGEIIIDGVDITAPGIDINRMRRKMGMVFQSFNLFSHRMVIENIMMAPIDLLHISRQEAYDEAMRLLVQVGLEEKALAYPDELSGGQKQRVAIARALAMHPQIILFDEPTSALDPTMVGEVLSVIRALAEQGMTMLIVTHEMSFARDISTRVFYMDEGVIYESGSPEQIFDAPQREKTRAFIQKIRTISFEVRSRGFDFLSLSSQIEMFGRRQMLSQKKIHRVQLVIEEALVNMLLEREPEPHIDLAVSCIDDDRPVTVTFTYTGNAYHPFTDGDPDDFALKILHKQVSRHEHAYTDGVNRLVLEV